MNKKGLLLIIFLLFSAGVFARFFGAFECESCGNTTEARAQNTFNRLNDIRSTFPPNLFRIGDTIRILGGDDSNPLYQIVQLTSSTPWQCVIGCDIGDEIPGFIPPGSNSGGGNSGGSGGSGGSGSGGSTGGSGGGSTGGGGNGGLVCGFVCSGGSCARRCVAIN